MRIHPKRVVLSCILISFLYGLFYLTTRKFSWKDEFWKYSGIMNLKRGKRFLQKYEQKDWQPVSGSKYLFSIYSAYSLVPNRLPPEVIIIGVTRTNRHQKILCRFHMKDTDTFSSGIDKMRSLSLHEGFHTRGSIETMKEHWKRNYSGVFVRCPLPTALEETIVRPEMVSVLMDSANATAEEPSNKVKIQYQYEYRNESESPKYNFTFSVCVLPTYTYNETFRLLEWIEFYKIMGVEQFTFYNVSFGPDASCILKDLMGGSDPSIKVNVHPWHENPVKETGQIRGNCAECSLSAGQNECLYRHRGRNSKYMVFVDLDEYLMPRQNIISKNYSQLIARLDAENPTKNIAHYQFKNGFFLLNRPDDPDLRDRCYIYKDNPLKYDVCQGSLMMRKVRREKVYQRFRQRSKYIIKPEGVRQAGTHFVHQFQLGYKYTTLKVSEEVAFLRHYRNWGKGWEKGANENDKIPLEFGLDLVERISNKVEYFRNKCKLNNVVHRYR